MTVAATRQAMDGFFLEGRRRSAVALLVGALVMELVIQQQVLRFYYTPLIVGLTYLTAALVAGRKGALWAPGIVTTCWGISVLLGVHGVVHLKSVLLYNIAAAIGVALALALRFAIGLAAGVVGLVISVAVILVHDYAHSPSWIFHGVTFAVLLGVWGLWELRPSATKTLSPPAAPSEQRESLDLRDRTPAAATRA